MAKSPLAGIWFDAYCMVISDQILAGETQLFPGYHLLPAISSEIFQFLPRSLSRRVFSYQIIPPAESSHSAHLTWLPSLLPSSWPSGYRSLGFFNSVQVVQLEDLSSTM
ncbi:hypothetical protein CC2G_013438 [Coprinopsis cinerea AmutBmut pab1-1]|nr:hypothetical protein CC2G_013438 [Coprinopsis cinerea AmutBmut pab1-1]